MNILLTKGASYHSISSVWRTASEVTMVNVHVAELPATSPDRGIALERGSPEMVEYDDPAPIAALRRTAPRPIAVADLTDTGTTADDDTRPARGLMNGVLLAVPLWGLIGLVTWFVLAW